MNKQKKVEEEKYIHTKPKNGVALEKVSVGKMQ